eukprot:gene12664-16975_t
MSAVDRLKELKRGAASPDDVAIEVNYSDKVGLVGGKNSSGKGNDFMSDFFGDVEIVKSNIVEIREATRKISEINQNVIQATTNEKEQENSKELTNTMKATNKRANVAKQLLQRLREDTDALKESSGSKQTPEIRIRENLVNTLTRKFVDVMKEYQNAQTKYKTDIKKKVKRQVQLVKPDATNEEIEAVFKSEGGAKELMIREIMVGDAADSIQNAFQNVQDKYKDVLALEASVAELHQMFLDFALLTEKQGELLDQIEHQVTQAAEHIDKGNEELVEAIELQKSIRRKQCCVAMIILIVLGIIAGLIAAKASGTL